MLPTRWCIKRTLGNHEIVNEWANSQKLTYAVYTSSQNYIYSEPINSKGAHVLSNIDENDLLAHECFTEITLDLFLMITQKVNDYSYLIPLLKKI